MSEIEFRFVELSSSELVDSTVLEHITNLQEFESNGYIFHPPTPSPSPQPSCSTSKSSDFPRRLPALLENEEALKGPLLCYLPQADDMSSQSIKKTFTEDNQVEPAFVYVRYYARVAVKTKKKMFSKNQDIKKEMYVWPAVRQTRTSSSRTFLQAHDKVGWLEALVQLDFSVVSKKEKKFEIGVRGFEKGDYLVIQKFGVTFGKDNINTDKLFGKCPSIVGSVADTDSSNPNSDREDTNNKQCRGADTEEQNLLQKTSTKSESNQPPRDIGFTSLQDCLQALLDCLRRSILRFLRPRCS